MRRSGAIWWWAQIVMALLAASSLSFFYVGWALPLDLQVGTSLLPDAVLMALADAMALGIVLAAFLAVRERRTYARLREAAMRGDQGAMPCADLTVAAVEGEGSRPTEAISYENRTAWLASLVVLGFAGLISYATVEAVGEALPGIR
jgi:hypothetical protein